LHRGEAGIAISIEIDNAMKKTKTHISPALIRKLTRRLDKHEKQLASLGKIITRLRKQRILINEK